MERCQVFARRTVRKCVTLDSPSDSALLHRQNGWRSRVCVASRPWPDIPHLRCPEDEVEVANDSSSRRTQRASIISGWSYEKSNRLFDGKTFAPPLFALEATNSSVSGASYAVTLWSRQFVKRSIATFISSSRKLSELASMPTASRTILAGGRKMAPTWVPTTSSRVSCVTRRLYFSRRSVS